MSDFWPTEQEYTEQPIINFKNEAIIFNFDDGASTGYASAVGLNDLFKTKINSPSVQVVNKYYSS